MWRQSAEHRIQNLVRRKADVKVVGRNLSVVVFLALVLGLVLSCNEGGWSRTIVTAQVSKTLDPETNTASVLLGKATVENIFREDWMETPDPGDSTFDAFPAKVTPIAGADVRVNSEPVSERLPGVYFKATMDLRYKARYDLEITLPDGKTVAAHGFLPDSFSITRPQPGDTLGPGPVAAVWTHSDSCEAFLVGITPADSGSAARGWADALRDTFCTIPDSAFTDALGNFVPGNYLFSVTAINGAWNKSGLDLLFFGGNVSGALGTFGCAVCPKPVTFHVK